ncbi:MAG: TIR domain-containing protein [Thermomicrobiales bacterium]|nr:TIR domain-containing protein [Thermomicrobiales bacterium]
MLDLPGDTETHRGAHLFVSYASSDRERALAIADALEATGVPVWIDRRGIGGGELWAAEITAAIRSCATVLLVCTAASVQSRNVRQEVQLAWDHDRPIVPLLLERVRFPDEIAYFLQGRQWIEVDASGDAEWIDRVVKALDHTEFRPIPSSASVPTPVATTPPAPPSPVPMATNLPVPPSAIIGRDEEIAAVCALLGERETRLVTLTGPGGVGKTRLALAVGWRLRETFEGAITFVNLAPVRDPALVLPEIAASAGLNNAGQETLVAKLHTALRSQPVLLVLDNCEQVLEASGEIGELLAGLPDLKVLATSREPLRLRAEQTIDIPPLTVDESAGKSSTGQMTEIPAVALFVARASAAKRGFALTNANRAAVHEICRRLDGLPMAIELAAARSSLLAPEAMLSRLEQRLPLLTGGARDLPERQRTLRDAIGWSEDLLTEDERAVLRRLSVFVGGFTLEAALAVTDTPGELRNDVDVFGAMERLAAHSLLRQVVSEEGEARFTMLEVIREFGLERLEASGESAEAHQRHAVWFRDLAERAAPEFTGPNQREWLQRFSLEQDNVRAALGWAVAEEPETALRLCAALLEFWILTSTMREGTLWCRRALEAGEEANPAFVAETTVVAARLGYRQGDDAVAKQRGEEALQLFQQLGDERGVALAMMALAMASTVVNEDLTAVEALLSGALDRMRMLNDRKYIAMIASNLSLTKMYLGDFDAAIDLARESAAMCREIGDRLSFIVPVTNMVEALVILGRVEEALPLLQELVEDQRRLGHRANLGFLLNCVGFALGARGEGRQAVRLYAAADAEFQLTGTPSASEIATFAADTERLRQELGAAEFEAEWTAGHSLAIEAAMEAARAALDAWEAETKTGGP